MMMNLFSIFDPSVYTLKLGWFLLFSVIMIMYSNNFLFSTMGESVKIIFLSLLSKEHKLLVSKISLPNTIIMLTLFMFLLINTLSLSMYIMTPTVHLSLVLPLSLIIWLSIISWSIINFTNEFLCHLVPIGTPFLLLFFMVVIESISSIIRPLTLTIRLISNMLAGHLMMELISSVIVNFLSFSFVSFPVLTILSILEMAVSIIQAYVYSTLMTLYLSEVI